MAAPAAAQEAAPQLPEDPRAPRFREVEHGAFTGLQAGWIAFFRTPVADPVRYPGAGRGGGFASGMGVTLQVGVEIGSRLALSAVAIAAQQDANVSYGSFGLVGGGGDLRLALAGMRDSQAVERFRLYLHARGAWFSTDPHGLFGTTDVLVAAGPGIEYATRLRHFSVGLAIDGLYALKAKAAGIAVLPSLRYTF